MSQNFERRHSRWYEKLVFSESFQILLGFALVVLLPAWLRWPEEFFSLAFSQNSWNAIITNALAFSIFVIAARSLRNFPGAQSLGYVFPIIAIAWLIGIALLFFFRLEYARKVIFYSYLLANLWVLIAFFVRRKYRSLKLAVVPIGRALNIKPNSTTKITHLEKPQLNNTRYDAVVADLHNTKLGPEWERFLAKCALAKIPVFNVKQVQESLTGKVQTEYLAENEIGALLPSAFYGAAKRFIDLTLVLVSSPIWLPAMLITGIMVKLESPGPMFFTQERIGQGNKPFTVFKLRSMTQDSEKDGAQFAQNNDMRVTRVGKFIRKTRLDELPQFINVLKGDMSIIGPRPEQKAFVEQFETEIPFYSYRHVVKPGITGWAQVTQGYAADIDETREKIQYDLYYIKHFSLGLDVLIILKTIRTIATGYGAR